MSSNSKQLRAIITGASSGIGKATAVAFAQAGIDIAVLGRSQTKLAEVVATAQQLGVEAKAYTIDLTEVAQVRSRMRDIAQNFGNINILVNNAGMGYTNLLQDTSLSDWQQVINLNLTSVFECILALLPLMRDRGDGTIVNVASLAAHTPFPGWGAYSVSKAGLITLSKTLAAEERANGIRVVSVSPGAVNTPIWDTDTVKADFNREAMLTPEIVAQSILHTVLVPPQAVVEELRIMPSAGAL